MRIRILKALAGVIEGYGLSQFLPGCVYNVSEPLGVQLIALEAATKVRSTDPTTDDVDVVRIAGGVHVLPPDKAEDRPERRRQKAHLRDLPRSGARLGGVR